jgi:hypothetical protein
MIAKAARPENSFRIITMLSGAFGIFASCKVFPGTPRAEPAAQLPTTGADHGYINTF